MRKTSTALFLVTILAYAGCQPEASPDDTMDILADQDVQAILALDRQFQNIMASGDYEGLHAIFAPDAVSMPPSEPAIRGIDNIIARYEELRPTMTVTEFDTDSDVVDGDDTAGYQWGTYSGTVLTPDGGEETIQGKFMWILRHNENGWKVVADIWNSTPLSRGG